MVSFFGVDFYPEGWERIADREPAPRAKIEWRQGFFVSRIQRMTVL